MSNFCGVIGSSDVDENSRECMQNVEMRFVDFERIVRQVGDQTEMMLQEFFHKYEFLQNYTKESLQNEQNLEIILKVLQTLSKNSDLVAEDLCLNECLLEDLEKRTEYLEATAALETHACHGPKQKCRDAVICELAACLEELTSLAENYVAEEKCQQLQHQGLCYLTQVMDCQEKVLEQLDNKIDNLQVQLHNVKLKFDNAAHQIYKN